MTRPLGCAGAVANEPQNHPMPQGAFSFVVVSGGEKPPKSGGEPNQGEPRTKKVRRAEPWTGSAECYGSVASVRRITSLYPPYNSSLVGGLRLKERKAKSESHSFLVRRPTRRSRGRGVMLWPVFWESARPRPSIRALGSYFVVNSTLGISNYSWKYIFHKGQYKGYVLHQ